jgi:phage terminase large subunit-like protein
VDLVRIVVAIDPAATAGEGADGTGIVADNGANRDGYLLRVSYLASPSMTGGHGLP